MSDSDDSLDPVSPAPPPAGPGRAWVLLGLIALALVAGRVLLDSRAALRAGEAALAAGETRTAIRHLHHAVRMYVPGSPYVGSALGQLGTLADRAAADNEVETERAALEAIRSGLLGARSFYTPFAGHLAASDERLATLYARIEDPAVAGGASVEERRRWHRERLARRPGASVPASVMALGGFAIWLGAAVLFIRRGLDRSLSVRRSWALGCGLAFVGGFGLFLAGLRLA